MTEFSLYEIAWMFFIYAVIGWCTEVAYAAIKTGKFVNRGFLNGTVCPVYGFGVVIVVLLLTPLTEQIGFLFLGSLVITSALEFFTGWILEKLFHTRWWDYTDRRFNLSGYICLEFSMIWGLGATFVMCVIQPIILGFIHLIPDTFGLVCVYALLGLILFDLTATVVTIHKFQKHLKLLTRLAGEMRDISDKVGDNISEVVLNAADFAEDKKERYGPLADMLKEHRAEEKALAEAHRAEEQMLFSQLRQEGRTAAEEKRAERQEDNRKRFEELKGQFVALLSEHNVGQQRLLQAFGGMKSQYYQEVIDRLRAADIRDRKKKEMGTGNS